MHSKYFHKIMHLYSSYDRFLLMLFLVLCLFSSGASAASWQASLDDSNGLPKLSKGGGEALSSSFVFFDKKLCLGKP